MLSEENFLSQVSDAASTAAAAVLASTNRNPKRGTPSHDFSRAELSERPDLVNRFEEERVS